MEKITKEQINKIIEIAKLISADHKKGDMWGPDETQLYMEVARNNLIISLETVLTINNL